MVDMIAASERTNESVDPLLLARYKDNTDGADRSFP
jgi:hypothetical protein